MNDIMKIVQAIEDSNILLKGVAKTIKNKTKEQKGGFLCILLGTLGASLLGNDLTGNGIIRAGSGNKKGKGIVRAGTFLEFLMLPHPLTNFEIQKDYQNEPRFNGVFQEIICLKDGAYVINLDDYADVGTHWIALFCNRNEIVYFDSFGVEHVPKEIQEFIGNKNIKANICRVQANNSVMCGYFCIGSIDFMLVGKKLTDFTNLFYPYDFKKNHSITLSYFKDE